ncbi:hypothetical protein J6590_065113 [Homalodisca vitripennis]|nr:hypothetical protein J6590_065113 [Homalodisca vitripennis]
MYATSIRAQRSAPYDWCAAKSRHIVRLHPPRHSLYNVPCEVFERYALCNTQGLPSTTSHGETEDASISRSLTIDGKKFSWTDGKLISGHLDGAKRLSELTGHDFTKFLTKHEGEDDGGRPRSQRTPSPGAVTTLWADSSHRR